MEHLTVLNPIHVSLTNIDLKSLRNNWSIVRPGEYFHLWYVYLFDPPSILSRSALIFL